MQTDVEHRTRKAFPQGFTKISDMLALASANAMASRLRRSRAQSKSGVTGEDDDDADDFGLPPGPEEGSPEFLKTMRLGPRHPEDGEGAASNLMDAFQLAFAVSRLSGGVPPPNSPSEGAVRGAGQQQPLEIATRRPGHALHGAAARPGPGDPSLLGIGRGAGGRAAGGRGGRPGRPLPPPRWRSKGEQQPLDPLTPRTGVISGTTKIQGAKDSVREVSSPALLSDQRA